MAPIKAILRSKLDKADTAKSLQELLADKYEALSDATSAVSSVDYQASCDSEADVSDCEIWLRQQRAMMTAAARYQPELLLPFNRTVSDAPATGAAATSGMELPVDMSMQYFSQIIYQQMLQQHQQPQVEEQPLNLTCHKALKRPAPKFEAVETDEFRQDGEQNGGDDVFDSTSTVAKRSCPDAAVAVVATAATAAPSQRKRKRSYRLSDNEEIRAYQYSAPELFIWNGHKPMIHQFLLKLLNNASCSGLIRWLDRENRLFKVLQPVTVARLWQFIKGNRTDNYECFARGIRHSRDVGKYFESHEFRKKKVYKFSEKALKPASEQSSYNRLSSSALTAHDVKPLQLVSATNCKGESSVTDPNSSSVDVVAKLKLALAGRILQQQQQHQQQQQLQLPLRQVSVKEEPNDSALVIADCDYL